MDVDTQVAWIGLITSLIVGLIPVFVRYFQSKGLDITIAQEKLVRDATLEAARFAEEYARKKPSTSQEKLSIAVGYAQNLLTAQKIQTRSIELAGRVEAAIEPAFPGRSTSERKK